MASHQDDHGNRAPEGRRLSEQQAADEREARAILAGAHDDGRQFESVVDAEADRLLEIGRQQNPDETGEDWGDRARWLAVMVCIVAVFGYMIYGLLSVYVFK